METSLQSLFQAIAQAQDESELRQPVMAQVGEYFAATRWGLSFLDELTLYQRHGFRVVSENEIHYFAVRLPGRIGSVRTMITENRHNNS
jgi:GAF domain-containing protein